MRVAFYGCGNIAQSIIEGLIEDGFKSEDIFYVDRITTERVYQLPLLPSLGVSWKF